MHKSRYAALAVEMANHLGKDREYKGVYIMYPDDHLDIRNILIACAKEIESLSLGIERHEKE